MKLEFLGRLNDLGFEVNKFFHVRRHLPFYEDKELSITVEVHKNKRSNAQNRYLHGVIVPAVIRWVKETQGETTTIDEAKAFIYKSVLDHRIVFKTILNEEVMLLEGKHFSKMTTTEFNEAKEKVQKYFSERGLEIPDPVETNHINYFV